MAGTRYTADAAGCPASSAPIHTRNGGAAVERSVTPSHFGGCAGDRGGERGGECRGGVDVASDVVSDSDPAAAAASTGRDDSGSGRTASGDSGS